MAEYLEIPVAGKHGSVKLVVYPQSSKAKVFDMPQGQATDILMYDGRGKRDDGRCKMDDG